VNSNLFKFLCISRSLKYFTIYNIGKSIIEFFLWKIQLVINKEDAAADGCNWGTMPTMQLNEGGCHLWMLSREDATDAIKQRTAQLRDAVKKRIPAMWSDKRGCPSGCSRQGGMQMEMSHGQRRVWPWLFCCKVTYASHACKRWVFGLLFKPVKRIIELCKVVIMLWIK
jgi:hypothetical protein